MNAVEAYSAAFLYVQGRINKTGSKNQSKKVLMAVMYGGDNNQENVQVLAEYQADEKLCQTYTYGNVRESVDKTDGIRYYIGDGLGSVTGTVDEKGNI